MALRNLKCRRIRCDEIWAFVYAKAKNLPEKYAGAFGYGDVWTWAAIDGDSKLVPSLAVGRRWVHGPGVHPRPSQQAGDQGDVECHNLKHADGHAAVHPMPSRRKWTTTRPRWHSTSCTTTSRVSTGHSE